MSKLDFWLVVEAVILLGNGVSTIATNCVHILQTAAATTTTEVAVPVTRAA
jgi:hypothetical protein